MDNWINIKDSLPCKEYNMYQVYCKSYDCEWQMIVHFEDGIFFETVVENNKEVSYKNLNEIVTHWQPLPQPPTS